MSDASVRIRFLLELPPRGIAEGLTASTLPGHDPEHVHDHRPRYVPGPWKQCRTTGMFTQGPGHMVYVCRCGDRRLFAPTTPAQQIAAALRYMRARYGDGARRTWGRSGAIYRDGARIG